MINSSDLLEYIPNGRITASKHPEFVETNDYISTISESTFSEKLLAFEAETKSFTEFWNVQDNKQYQEEELYCFANLVVHSKGDELSNALQTSYFCETKILHAIWCEFYADDKFRLFRDELDAPDLIKATVSSLCVFDSKSLKVFTEMGENYMSSLQCKVSAVWSTKYGILLEKSILPLTSDGVSSVCNMNNISSSEESISPTVFSLSHPLDDACPILIKFGNTTAVWDVNFRIIFTSCDPSFAFIFDTKTGLHSIYKIRKASAEEYRQMNIATDSSYFTHNSLFSSTCIKNTTVEKRYTNRKTCPGSSSSPFRAKGSYSNSGNANASIPSHLSKSHSPMATISRCQSPTNPILSSMINTSAGYCVLHRSNQTLLALSAGQLDQQADTCKKNFNRHSCRGYTNTAIPYLCLEHLWTESIGLTKDNNIDGASKVFLTTDFLKQTYFCYLLQHQFRLHIIRLEKSNEPEHMIFGIVTTITAKDAINLPKLNLMALMDLNGNILVYSGTAFVGKLHIQSLVSNILGNSYQLTNSYGRELLSPYPRRSSLISPSKSSTSEIKFDEDVHLLSPVGRVCVHLYNTDHSVLESGSFSFNSTVSNKLILKFGDANYFKVNIPSLKASPLISLCLRTLQKILPRDLTMKLLIKWYVTRNAPGPQDLTTHQEWNLFLVTFFTLFGYDVNKLKITKNNYLDYTYENCSPVILSKKQKTINGSIGDWYYLLTSEVTNEVHVFIHKIIHLEKSKHVCTENIISTLASENISIGSIDIQSTFILYLPQVLFSFHLLYEELKLSCNMSENLFLLAKLLYQLSMDLHLEIYKQHYLSDFPCLSKNRTVFPVNNLMEFDICKVVIPGYMLLSTPNIFQTLYELLTFSKLSSYPYLDQVNIRSKDLIQVLAMYRKRKHFQILELDHFFKSISCSINNEVHESKVIEIKTEEIIMQCYKIGMKKQDLDNLPAGISYIFSNIVYECREKPPSDWPYLVYEFVDRQDLAVLYKNMSDNYRLYAQKKYSKDKCNFSDLECNDGMGFDYTILRLRFCTDHRVREVRKLLNSSEPMKISILQRADVSDHEFIEEQEKFLHALCTRTMALPIGRGMFTLRTSMPINTEQLPIPRLCLSGKAPPRGTTIELAHIDVPSNLNLWPLFHNGVATGLCIHPCAANVDSTWIVYNKQQQGEFGIEHSGFLMALGLNGHLKNLAPFSMYEYLVECHEATSVGLLLGLSATHRSSMDVSMTKLLSLHVETLLPPTSIELNVQQNVQVAALMGVGLVYQGTNHRHIAYALLSEIGRPPGPEMKNCIDRESYSLAAGLALGLVLLSSGVRSDLANIPDTLHYYMVGGNTRPFNGAQRDKYRSPSYQIKEGDSINIDITSPGATIALGFMYLQSGNKSIAEWMNAPNTQYLLDFVRPDLLILRILAKSLILWDQIEPSKTWISSHVPYIVGKYKLRKPNADVLQPIDLETINQAYCNIIAGACMAVGLKYAGTENLVAFNTLFHFLKMFMTLSHKSVSELAGKATIETCLNVVLLSASLVMAGTGNLEILKVCRHVRARVGPSNSVVTYGSHLSIHMALGFLFLGGGSYTLSNDPSAIAALVIALFPKFPTHSNDNRYHLQALRHFYVLATEPRLLLPKDIDNGNYCYAKIRLTFFSDNQKEGQKILLKAPCLLPQLNRLKKIELDDDRYWNITFDAEHNFDFLDRILKANSVLHVKQRAGCLSHKDDPQGFRSLLAQTLTTDDIIVWTASLKQITSFSTDTIVLNFVDRFLKTGNLSNQIRCDIFCMNKIHDKIISLCFTRCQNSIFKNLFSVAEVFEIPQEISVTENQNLKILINMAYECVIKDKIRFLPLWINIYKILISLEYKTKVDAIWQLKFLQSFIFYNCYYKDEKKLLSTENVLANKQYICLIMDSWESEISYILNDLKSEPETIGIETFEKVVSYTLNYDILCKINQFLLHNAGNSFQQQNISCLKAYGAFRYSTLFKKNINLDHFL